MEQGWSKDAFAPTPPSQDHQEHMCLQTLGKLIFSTQQSLPRILTKILHIRCRCVVKIVTDPSVMDPIGSLLFFSPVP